MKVSVLVVTYNQKNFAPRAVASALMQKTNFEFEIVVGDDCSTDGTLETLSEIQHSRPDRVRLLPSSRNLGFSGKNNFVRTLRACRGHYVAVLEGDDYWTSPHKLQRQADFLDQNPDCSAVFHNVLVVYEGKTRRHLFHGGLLQNRFSCRDLLHRNWVASGSVMFRNRLWRELPPWFFRTLLGDWALHVIHSRYGDLAYLDEVLGVYRIHRAGVWSAGGSSAPVQEIRRLKEHLHFYRLANEYLECRYDRLIRREVADRCYQIAGHYRRLEDWKNVSRFLMRGLKSAPEARKPLRLFLAVLFRGASPALYRAFCGLRFKDGKL